METKHTPGPWKLRRAKYKSEHDFILANENQYIAAWSFHDGVKSTKEKSEHIANALLIAVAPDLLSLVLEMFAESENSMKMLGMPMLSIEWHKKASAAISKALPSNALNSAARSMRVGCYEELEPETQTR